MKKEKKEEGSDAATASAHAERRQLNNTYLQNHSLSFMLLINLIYQE